MSLVTVVLKDSTKDSKDLILSRKALEPGRNTVHSSPRSPCLSLSHCKVHRRVPCRTRMAAVECGVWIKTDFMAGLETDVQFQFTKQLRAVKSTGCSSKV